MGRHPKQSNGRPTGNVKKHGKPLTSVEGGVPEPPADLDSEAREVWLHTTELLEPSGCLALCDDQQLRMYCEDVVERRRIQGLLSSEDDVDALAKLYRLKSVLDVNLRAAMKTLGLNPAARSQLRVGVGESGGECNDADVDYFGGDGDE